MVRSVKIELLLAGVFLGGYVLLGWLGSADVPAYLFNAVDEACKALLAVWLVLRLKSTLWRSLAFVVGTAAFVELPYLFMPSELVTMYAQALQDDYWRNYAIRDFFVRTIHFSAVSGILLSVHLVMRIRLVRSLEERSSSSPPCFSAPTELLVPFLAAGFVITVHFLRRFVCEWYGTPVSAYVIYPIDAVRLSVFTIACLVAVFVTEHRLAAAALVFVVAMATCLAVPYAFRLESMENESIFANWVSYGVIQFVVLFSSLNALRMAGYQLKWGRSAFVVEETRNSVCSRFSESTV